MRTKSTGYTAKIITNADGTKTQVIEKNLTPEQQDIENNLKRLSEQSLAKYESLVNDPFLETMPEYKAQIDTLFNSQNRSLTDNFRAASRETETAASRFGVDDSTAATQLRAQNTNNYAGAKQQLSDDKLNMVNSVRQQEMSNQLGMYGLASGRQDTLLSKGCRRSALVTQSPCRTQHGKITTRTTCLMRAYPYLKQTRTRRCSKQRHGGR